MNSGYNMANKRKDMAAKMPQGLTMNGGEKSQGSTTMNARGHGGMKYKENGVNSGKGGGMKYPENGKDQGYAKGMKEKQSNPKANFIGKGFYNQNGNK